MQDTCYCFPTEVAKEPPNKPPTSIRESHEFVETQKAFRSYVQTFDEKIARGMQKQQFNVNIRKRLLTDQLQEIHAKHQSILEDVRRRESYFEEHYFRYLRDDISKFTEYNEFFKREFSQLHRKIEDIRLANTKRRMLADSLKERLKQLMKQNRQMERSGSHREKILPKLKNTESTEASIRMTTEPDRFPSALSSCRELPPLTHHYMNPLVRSTRGSKTSHADKWLELLLQLLEFRRSDAANKEWTWIEDVVFRPKHFARLRSYLQHRIETIRKN